MNLPKEPSQDHCTNRTLLFVGTCGTLEEMNFGQTDKAETHEKICPFTCTDQLCNYEHVINCLTTSPWQYQRRSRVSCMHSKFGTIITGSPSALCVGSGFRGHLVGVLELLVYYLMPNKYKNLKDTKSSCLSICTGSL